MAEEKVIDKAPSGSNGLYDNEKQSNTGSDADVGVIERDNSDQLKRHLGNRQIQLIAIGGAIGTALFVSIGGGLQKGGPGSLLIAYMIQAVMVAMITTGLAEMTVYMPISGSFIRFAGNWVDEAWGFMTGYNFFFYEAFLIPFEIAALNLVLQYWSDKIPVAAIIVACIVLYALLNVIAVEYFGEAEFWLAGGKVILILIVFSFTFVTMVGGNPQKDAYGFRYWKEPGAFAEHLDTGALGRFHGFMGALGSAVFTVVGPEYLSMVAGEAERPRVYLKAGFKTVYWRFGFFFIIGALACGIILPYNEPQLDAAGSGTADGSPYVIAMQLMGIDVLPHIVNALLCTSIFSAGNAYTYCSMRCLYGLALQGHAPAFLKKCLKNGIPIYCFAIVMLFPFLTFFQVSAGTAKVVSLLQSLTSASGLINYISIGVSYIHFYNATQAQGLDRRTLPFRGYFQPYLAYIGVAWMTLMVLTFGYTVFMGPFVALDFFSYYLMVIVGVITYGGWKLLKRTHRVRPAEADLVWDKPVIDAYEAKFTEAPTRFRDDIKKILRLGKKSKNQEEIAANPS